MSDTETEIQDDKPSMPPPPPPPYRASSLKPVPADTLRKRQSMGDSSGYVSTDSEWDKVSDAEEKSQ